MNQNGQPSQETGLNFITGYPKSGSTWIRLACTAYAMGTTDEYQQQSDINPWAYQSVSPIPIYQLGVSGEAQVRGAAMLYVAREQEGPALVKSHHASVDVGGTQLWSNQWARRVVVPVRDPRDVCPSLADHMGMTLEEAVEFLGNSEAVIGGDDQLHHVLGSWSDHVGSWMRQDRVESMIVRYEDMHADTEGEIEKILKFLGVQRIESERIEAAVELSSFDRMQEIEEERDFPETSDYQERFFRKGEVRAWEDDLPKELAQKIENDHSDIMQKVGYV